MFGWYYLPRDQQLLKYIFTRKPYLFTKYS